MSSYKIGICKSTWYFLHLLRESGNTNNKGNEGRHEEDPTVHEPGSCTGAHGGAATGDAAARRAAHAACHRAYQASHRSGFTSWTLWKVGILNLTKKL